MGGFIEKSAACVVPGKAGVYGHRFGGPAFHDGAIPKGQAKPLELLYVFDCNDPLVPVGVPGVRHLPLYYGFHYDAAGLGYRVVSDQRIEILYQERDVYCADFPFDNFVAEFPQVPVSLEAIDSQDYRLLQRYIEIESQEYGVRTDRLSAQDELRMKELGHPFTQLGGRQLMMQGIPEVKCPDDSCPNHKVEDALEVFAVVWDQPVRGVYLWDDETDPEKRGDEWSQLIFQICPRCRAIHVCNRCD